MQIVAGSKRFPFIHKYHYQFNQNFAYFMCESQYGNLFNVFYMNSVRMQFSGQTTALTNNHNLSNTFVIARNMFIHFRCTKNIIERNCKTLETFSIQARKRNFHLNTHSLINSGSRRKSITDKQISY